MNNPTATAVLESMRRPSPGGNLRWDCPSHGCYRDSLPDWTPLNDCFPRAGIRVSDIDGMVEVSGHFLFIEWKHPNLDVPEGQLRALQRLSNLPRCTVLIVWGVTTSNPEKWQVISDGTLGAIHPVDFDTWHAFITAWASLADGKASTSSHLVPPRPSRPGRAPENLVPNLVPVPFRDEGDEGRGNPDDPHLNQGRGTRLGTSFTPVNLATQEDPK